MFLMLSVSAIVPRTPHKAPTLQTIIFIGSESHTVLGTSSLKNEEDEIGGRAKTVLDWEVQKGWLIG